MVDSLNPSTAAKRGRAYTEADEKTFRDRSHSRRRSIEQSYDAGNDGIDGDSDAEAAGGGDGSIDLEEGVGKIERGDRKDGDDKAGEGGWADKLDVEDGDNVDTEVGVNIKAEDESPSIDAEDGVINAGLDDITRKIKELKIRRKKYQDQKREEGTWKEKTARMRKQRS